MIGAARGRRNLAGPLAGPVARCRGWRHSQSGQVRDRGHCGTLGVAKDMILTTHGGPIRTIEHLLAASAVLWLAVICGSAAASAQSEPVRELRLQILDRAEPGGGLVVIAGEGARAKRVEVDHITAARLAGVRFSVECAADGECHDQRREPIEGDRQVLGGEALQQVLEEVGKAILSPFADEIRGATRLRIQVQAHLVKIAIDALEFDGAPLYVQKPIMYTIDRDIAPSAMTIDATSVGLLISDRTADPQRAVYDVADLFPKSVALDAGDFDGAGLDPSARFDFVVISAHGRAGYEDSDLIALPGRRILPPDEVARLRPQLVYFDSCNLGVSLRYLQELQRAGVKFVLAPIVSNEAGESSTLTMRTFFQEIAAGRDPVTALYVTRRRAYELYGRHDVMDQLWRAFPFRVYALN